MRRTAGVILVHKDHVLTVRGADTGIWSFPKGSVFPGESTTAAALRELCEETGIQLTEDALGGAARFTSGRGVYYIVHVDERPTPTGGFDTNEVDLVLWMPSSGSPDARLNSALRRWCLINGGNHPCVDSTLPVTGDCL